MIRPSAFCLISFVAFVSPFLASRSSAADWKPAPGPLTTKWGKEVNPEKVHPEYPRPQMVREKWTNLNGLWQYAIAAKNAGLPEKFAESILVPFCIESSLSGVGKRVSPQEKLWYRRTFAMPALAAGERYLIHFGAVDWEANVFVNGKKVGEHRGGYDPFSFDITAALDPKKPEQELVVSVWDPTDSGPQPRGKQIGRPHGIWYTPITGIWQTVWLETVPAKYIERLVITPNIESGEFQIKAEVKEADGLTLRVVAGAGNNPAGSGQGSVSDVVKVKIAEPRLWSPSDPFLYDLVIELREGEKVIDRVSSYSGLRKISLGRDADGVMRILLNGKFVFQYGPLDQGFWPDGLYTAPSDAALKYDVEITKRLGFNMIRKHVKVEPARWYYHCDKLGILVWQDMPSGDRYIGAGDLDIQRTADSARQFEAEWRAIVTSLINHPSIVMWVPFNEGWGQFDTARIADYTRQLDPNRLVNSVSGWADRNVGDVHDYHVYPGPGIPPKSETRALVLGEFGGLGLPLEKHTWQAKDNWGYRSYEDRVSLQAAYLELVLYRLRPLIGEGLSAAVYTQTTDVEIEVNGLMTYDRAVLKLDEAAIIDAHRKLYLPPPTVRSIIPTAKTEKLMWHHTYDAPAKGWEKPDSDAKAWKEAPAGFGTEGTPGAKIGTNWGTNDVYLWRKFTLPEVDTAQLYFDVHHDEDCEIYLNGELAAKLGGFSTDYAIAPISAKARATLKRGENVIAVHCRQTRGGQYVDVGIVEVKEAEVKSVGLKDDPKPADGGKLAVTIAESADSILKGQTITYTIEVENRQKVADKNVSIVVLLPVGVTYSKFLTSAGDIRVQRVSADHREFDLTPIEELRAGERFTFRVDVTATKAGKFTTRVQARSESQRQPIIAKEDTTIFEE